MIFQDPYASLNPRKRVAQIVGDPAAPPGGHVRRRAQAQRAGAARAGRASTPSTTTATRTSSRAASGSGSASPARSRCEPKLIIADEPVSALDVSIQAQIINLLEDLQDDFELTYVFVAHDLGVVRHVSDRIAVMYLGKIVEIGPADEVYSNPIHPYTLSLLSAMPIPDPRANAVARADRARGRRAEPGESAGGLPVPHPLPVRDRDLLRGRAAADRPRRRPLGRLPSPARPRAPRGRPAPPCPSSRERAR